MKKLIAILILLSFATPVRAGLVTDFQPVEQKLLDSNKALEQDLNDTFKQTQHEPLQAEQKPAEKSSNWWKWVLGIVVVGALAAGGGGGGGGAAPAGGAGSVSGTW